MTSPWLIIADDLTGAADCAIAFAKHGLESVVAWEKHTDAGGVQVLSVDAATRRLPPAQAAKLQADVLATHYRPGLRLYKKIDSTVRGQPAAELAGLLAYAPAQSEGRSRLAIVAPAFPGTGRVTVNGSIVVQGVPLERTPLWAREHTYASANLVEMLASAGLSAEVLPLDAAGHDPEKVFARLASARARGLAAVVCDAKTEADLLAVATGSLPMADDVIWVGSGGLATALAAVETHSAQPAQMPPLMPGQKNVLVVVGTLAEASRLQAKTLVEAALVRHLVISPEALFAGPSSPAWQQASKELARHFATQQDVLLELEQAAKPDLSRGALLSERLAAFVQSAGTSFAGLIATGGDTVYALLSKLGVHSIRLLDEVEPGVPLGITVGAVSIPVVTKAGAFGDAQSLRRSLERLHR
ncbi:MAG: four-carbon acid sugar kinase family protein [Candidatus Korobacteraceae bacterium]